MAATPSPPDLAVRGSKAYLESAMVMSVAADGRSALTLRFCRFPVEGATWLWCHLVQDGRLYAFTQHDLPCDGDRLAGAPSAAYRAPPLDARLEREGGGAQLRTVRLAAALPFHESHKAPHGPGKVQGRFEGVFTPTHALAAKVLDGRDEVYGRVRVEGEIGGRRFVHEGPAKFHEQRQQAPRFEAPFCYGWLSGDGADATVLLVEQGAGGGWQFADREEPLADMVIDPPGARRAVGWTLRSGGYLPGRLDAIVRYEVPVFDRRWQGSFVRGEAGGRAVVGVMNDWAVPPDIYLAARRRRRTA